MSALARTSLAVAIAIVQIACDGSLADGVTCEPPAADAASLETSNAESGIDALVDTSSADDSASAVDTESPTDTAPPPCRPPDPPPVGPCDETRKLPGPWDEGVTCTAIVRLDYATHAMSDLSITCSSPSSGLGVVDADGLSLLAQVYSPAHVPVQPLVGSPYAFLVPGADALHPEFVTVLDRAIAGPVFVTRKGVGGGLGRHVYPFSTSTLASCLPTRFPPATAVYPAGEAFDDALATSIGRQAWNSPLGYAWSYPRGTSMLVLRGRRDGSTTYTDWFVLVTAPYDSGGI